MFLHEPRFEAENGGGGNRTRVTSPQERLSRAEIVALLVERDGDECFYCGSQPESYQIDHVTPRARGGAESIENFVLACPSCNYEKWTHAGWLYMLLRELGPAPRVLPSHLPTSSGADWLDPSWMDPLAAWAHKRIAEAAA